LRGGAGYTVARLAWRRGRFNGGAVCAAARVERRHARFDGSAVCVLTVYSQRTQIGNVLDLADDENSSAEVESLVTVARSRLTDLFSSRRIALSEKPTHRKERDVWDTHRSSGAKALFDLAILRRS